MPTARHAFNAALACALAFPAAAMAQSPAKLSPDEIKSLATVHAAILVVQDSVDKELSLQKNKKDETQLELREKMRTQVAAILKKNSLTDSAYQRRRFVVSTDGASRRTFDSTLAVLTGAPLPGQVRAVVAPAPTVTVPAGPVGTHIGHVANSFMDTPDKSGLLPMAIAEQKIAAQHAMLALRNPMNLAMLQLHSGHIINALDPTVVTAGPGKQYGVKRAATGIAAHIELAAKAEGATTAHVTHSKHVATAARSTVARADQIIALAQKIQMSTDANAAAQMMSQISQLCDQLMTGADTNSDGRMNWDAPEGGLAQVQEHVTIMLAPPKP